MRTPNPDSRRRQTAFTLIELLVVIAVIGVLAALIVPVAGAIKKKQMISVAQAELNQVSTAIEAYKAKKGFYPPDNPGNPLINQLYFELEGTVVSNSSGGLVYTTLDGAAQIRQADLNALFGPKVTGFVNSSSSAQGSDEAAPAINFLPGLRPNEIGQVMVGGTLANALLVCSVDWGNIATEPVQPPLLPTPPRVLLNPWRYVSSNPTNNPGSYDLWVDFVVGGKTNRVSNWSKEAQIVP